MPIHQLAYEGKEAALRVDECFTFSDMRVRVAVNDPLANQVAIQLATSWSVDGNSEIDFDGFGRKVDVQSVAKRNRVRCLDGPKPSAGIDGCNGCRGEGFGQGRRLLHSRSCEGISHSVVGLRMRHGVHVDLAFRMAHKPELQSALTR